MQPRRKPLRRSQRRGRLQSLITLEFRVLFLNGEYNGEEWPPSPARLFQALIAGARYRYRRGAAWSPKFDEALRWLENQKPPIITVMQPAIPGSSYIAYRPANNLERELEIEGQKQGQSMHPLHVQEAVCYIYEVEDPPYDTLREMAQSVVCFGRGTDLVAVNLILGDDSESQKGERYYPLEWSSGRAFYGGAYVKTLQVPVPGWYDRLEDNFKVWYKYDESVPNAASATVPASHAGVEYAPVRNRALYWIFKLETPEGLRFSYPAEALVRLSAWMRHATGEALKGKVSEDILKGFVMGHTEKVDAEDRLSYIPLPSAGSEHADGRIRRVMLAALRGSLPDGISEVGGVLDQSYLYDLNNVARARLVLLDRPEVSDGVSMAYTGKSDVWSTVTPIILHGHDFRNGKVDPRRTQKLLIEAVSQAGYSGLVDYLEYSKLPFNSCGRHVKEYSLPEHLRTWPRYHVRVKFTKEITGPILAGIGKHYGLGLFVRSPSLS
jgi:CRISPR-associated protein Csb2